MSWPMQRSRPTQPYMLPTMPGSRRSSYSEDLAVAEEYFRQLEILRQRERQRGAGLCAHLNRHGCGLGAVNSQFGLCSACSYFCTYSENDPRRANTDTTFMTREEAADLDLALARRIMFCDADIVPTTPGAGSGPVEAVPATSAVAEAAEHPSAAHAQPIQAREQQARAQDTQMVDAPEEGLPRRLVLRSEEEMARDPAIIAYLEARRQAPVRSHPQPISFLAACARAEHEKLLAQNAEKEKLEREVARKARQREQYRILYEQHQKRQQNMREDQKEASRQKLLQLQKEGREMVERHQQRRHQEWLQRQQQAQQQAQAQPQTQKQQQEEEEEHDGEKGKGKAPEMVEQEHQQQTMTLPLRQTLPVETQGE